MNIKKYLIWIVLVVILIIASVYIIWYFNHPKLEIEVMDELQIIQTANLNSEEVICRLIQ